MVVNISCYLCILLYIQIILLNTTSVVRSYNKKKVLYSVQYMANWLYNGGFKSESVGLVGFSILSFNRKIFSKQ